MSTFRDLDSDSPSPIAGQDHGLLSGLTDDDHTQYARLAGRATGQVLQGGTAASETLTLSSTANATKGNVLIGAGAVALTFNEATGALTIPGGDNIVLGTSTGTKIGTGTNQLLGFYNATPVDQPATVADPAGGVVIDIEGRAAIVALIDRLQELGLIA